MDTSFQGTTETGTDVWLTPPEIVKALGKFDLDPCAPLNRPWDTASKHLTIEDDGLKPEWEGRVWMNPPYGKECVAWLEKLSKHGNGVALIFARTETRMFFDWIWDKADAVLFMKGRVRFYRPDGAQGGTAGAPSVLVAYGAENVYKLEQSGIAGKFIKLNV